MASSLFTLDRNKYLLEIIIFGVRFHWEELFNFITYYNALGYSNLNFIFLSQIDYFNCHNKISR